MSARRRVAGLEAVAAFDRYLAKGFAERLAPNESAGFAVESLEFVVCGVSNDDIVIDANRWSGCAESNVTPPKQVTARGIEPVDGAAGADAGSARNA